MEELILAQNIFLVLLLWKYADPAKGVYHGFVFWMLGLDPEGEVVTMLPVATIIATACALPAGVRQLFAGPYGPAFHRLHWPELG